MTNQGPCKIGERKQLQSHIIAYIARTNGQKFPRKMIILIRLAGDN